MAPGQPAPRKLTPRQLAPWQPTPRELPIRQQPPRRLAPRKPGPSPLEALLKTQARPSQILLSFLPGPADLLSLRLTSRTLATWVHQQCCVLVFATLILLPVLQRYKVDLPLLRGLEAVGPWCHALVLRLSHGDADPTGHTGGGERSPPLQLRPRQLHHAPTASQSLMPTTPQYWIRVLRLLPNLRSITVSIPGLPGPARLSPVEATLVALRLALERVAPPLFTTLVLHPVHVLGLLHLRWAGGTAYGGPAALPTGGRAVGRAWSNGDGNADGNEDDDASGGDGDTTADWMAGRVWTRMHTLQIWCMNPSSSLLPLLTADFSSSSSGTTTSLYQPSLHPHVARCVIHDHLQSLSASLVHLCWTWVGRRGPCVLFLDEPGPSAGTSQRFSAPPIRWNVLRRVSFSNTDVEIGHVRRLFAERARLLHRVRVQGGVILPGDERLGDLYGEKKRAGAGEEGEDGEEEMRAEPGAGTAPLPAIAAAEQARFEWDGLRTLGVRWAQVGVKQAMVHDFRRDDLADSDCDADSPIDGDGSGGAGKMACASGGRKISYSEAEVDSGDDDDGDDDGEDEDGKHNGGRGREEEGEGVGSADEEHGDIPIIFSLV
ncbi:MAG: hypothetical protein M1838_002939 [Thelocarpon superellum]|nr:MAG: hypothetical protein M1838_002939 [Thelocarpon superellum]